MPEATQIILTILVLVAAALDLKFRRIPNWLTVSGFVAGFVLQGWDAGWVGLRDAVLGAAVAFALYLGLFALRAVGAGDVKLMTAVGAMVGPIDWMIVFLIAAISGGVVAVFLLQARGTLLPTAKRALFVLGDILRLRVPYEVNPEIDISHPSAVTLPHGVSIAIGCLLFLWVWKV